MPQCGQPAETAFMQGNRSVLCASAGFSVAHTVDEVFVPTKVDLETGDVQSSSHEVHYFR